MWSKGNIFLFYLYIVWKRLNHCFYIVLMNEWNIPKCKIHDYQSIILLLFPTHTLVNGKKSWCFHSFIRRRRRRKTKSNRISKKTKFIQIKSLLWPIIISFSFFLFDFVITFTIYYVCGSTKKKFLFLFDFRVIVAVVVVVVFFTLTDLETLLYFSFY